MGAYRVLINVAGCGIEQVSYQCQPKEILEANISAAEIKDEIQPIQEVK